MTSSFEEIEFPLDAADGALQAVCAALRDLGVTVGTGVFSVEMVVEIVNDGPVTIVMDV